MKEPDLRGLRPSQWKESIIVPVYEIGIKVAVVIAINVIPNVSEYPPIKVKSIHR
jgi:hypothetical protein